MRESDGMTDYDVNVKVGIKLFLDSPDFDASVLSVVQQAFANDVTEVFRNDETLYSYVQGDLHFKPEETDGTLITLSYRILCHNENEEEAESWAEYMFNDVKDQVEALGCKVTSISCSAEESDMSWYDDLENKLFGQTPGL